MLNTPLSPHMGTEWLDCYHMYMSGLAIEGTGFTYIHPALTEELFRESIDVAVESGIFPSSSLS